MTVDFIVLCILFLFTYCILLILDYWDYFVEVVGGNYDANITPWFSQVLKKATIRKEQEPDFEEKRFNVTIGEDEWEFDKENDFFRERGYRITREIRDPG